MALLAPVCLQAGIYKDTLPQVLKRAAKRSQVPCRLLYGVASVESSFRHGALNPKDGKSPSYGLGQLKLSTARRFGTLKVTAYQLRWNDELNLTICGRALAYYLKLFHGNERKALSAYNAGHYTDSNKTYVKRVMERMKQCPIQ